MLKRGFAHVETSGQSPQSPPPASDNWAFLMGPGLPKEGSDRIYPFRGSSRPWLEVVEAEPGQQEAQELIC